ncbi:MAG: bifunctional proline dehydrogenase/L-glutamate gamma-semialdehyde dehydrogenase PutA [Alphaproteobacteria bacterium]
MTQILSQYLFMSEEEAVKRLLKTLPWQEAQAMRVENHAAQLVRDVRQAKLPMGQLESFLKDYALDTDEGLSLMCLAEALLRVPDKETANRLIRDKVAAANWLEGAGSSKDWVVKAAGVGLFMTNKTLDGVLARIGEPFIREAMVKAMGVLGRQFVLGHDIEDAVQNAAQYRDTGYRMSYDILGEGARTAADAERYFENYAHAFEYVAERGSKDEVKRPGISVKMSALHPRYEFAQESVCIAPMIERMRELARIAAKGNLAFTVDAEEANRLDLSLQIIEGVLEDPALKGWDGFGLAVQAYQKRAMPLLDHLEGLSSRFKRRLRVRLVKGAYWDTEIKHAQVEGVENFPVYTRKANTDVSFLACAHKLLNAQKAFYPMLATHNAHSLAGVLDIGREAKAKYELQRLYGMGKGLYDVLMKDHDMPVSIYAPVGPHPDLLPYLVRRLLENGANSSFVNRMLDPDAPVEELVSDPVEKVRGRKEYMHPKIQLPHQLYDHEAGGGRRNSRGVDLSDAHSVDQLLAGMSRFTGGYEATALVDGVVYKDSVPEDVLNPADHADQVGRVWPATEGLVNKAMRVADEAFVSWSGQDASVRAQVLDRAADLYEEHGDEILALLVREAGKTIPDAIAELREAIDFCRYYARQGRIDFARAGQFMPGPTGESNVLSLHGRGVFVCISPWNFPCAIYTGQIAAALMAGNAVVAKPAEQTPLIAAYLVDLLHEAGVPVDVLNLMPGDGIIGGALVGHKRVAGVAFTGSTEVAREINRTLAAKDGAIVPLIAETGGLNTMIVDSSALPEQVIDDVVLSAFGSAGQRCSALRVLCVQEDVADKMLRMLKGAMDELSVGLPHQLSSDIGPVIDDVALAVLNHHRAALKGFGKLIFEIDMDENLRETGHFFAPCAFEIDSFRALEREVFGPILHVIRYKKDELDDLLDDIDASGYALTLGVHSRIDEFQDFIVNRIRAGNAYVNRSIIGAVVGTQPFGGQGLSGTGPKAGGPHYLTRFATERVVSTDTTATGGNASLVTLSE